MSLEELQKRYAESLPGQILDVEQYWQEYKAHPHDLESLEKLLNACHKIAGTGATFGYPICGDSAREIEQTLRPLFEQQQQELPSQLRLNISKHLNQLRKAATPRKID